MRESVVYYDRGSSGYPQRLMPYEGMPKRLYVKGKLPLEERPTAAIVGARMCSAYGRAQALLYAEALAQNGVQIISGLAYGIDACAHQGALNGGGNTFAVLGCGVDICYPKENYPLLRSMVADGGGVMSEFTPGDPPAAWHFPVRNRVISALADVVLIIEAKEKSGSLITADYALEQGKTIFALPGRVSDALSRGCNRLIAQGACIAWSPECILEELGALPGLEGWQRERVKRQEKTKSAEKAAGREKPEETGISEETEQSGHSEKPEGRILEALSEGSRDLGSLERATGIPVSELSGILVRLQLDGKVAENPPGSYSRISR